MFLSQLYPYEYAEDVFSIDYAYLYQRGFRALVFDIDNTLVPHGADSTPEVDRLFRRLHSLGFKTLLLSDNSAARIERFNANIQTLYICDAGKPDPKGFERALSLLNTERSKTIVVGDQLFTDIRGANLSGLPSILVKYIGFYRKEKKGIRRNVEKIVLRLYGLSRKYQHRLGLPQ